MRNLHRLLTGVSLEAIIRLSTASHNITHPALKSKNHTYEKQSQQQVIYVINYGEADEQLTSKVANLDDISQRFNIDIHSKYRYREEEVPGQIVVPPPTSKRTKTSKQVKKEVEVGNDKSNQVFHKKQKKVQRQRKLQTLEPLRISHGNNKTKNN